MYFPPLHRWSNQKSDKTFVCTKPVHEKGPVTVSWRLPLPTLDLDSAASPKNFKSNCDLVNSLLRLAEKTSKIGKIIAALDAISRNN